jgi:hypothetical protein
MFGHALWRSLLLIALGVFLRSASSTQTNFTFEDTLSQIGMGYPFLFLLAWKPPKWQWIALAVILTGYWFAWALYPVPGPDFDYQRVGVPPDWQHHYTGFSRIGTRTTGQRFRPVVSESVPRSQPFMRIWRVPDIEFHSDTGHYAPGSGGRRWLGISAAYPDAEA